MDLGKTFGVLALSVTLSLSNAEVGNIYEAQGKYCEGILACVKNFKEENPNLSQIDAIPSCSKEYAENGGGD